MWLRNPLPRLKQSADDLQISRDLKNGGPSVDDSTFIYNGFCFVSSNEKTIAWFTRQKEKEEEDNVLYLVKSGVLRRQFGVTVGYLDTAYFGSLCQDELDAAKLIALHANCCPDAKAKLEGLRAILDVWKTYKNGNSSVAFPDHTSCTQSRKVRSRMQIEIYRYIYCLLGFSLRVLLASAESSAKETFARCFHEKQDCDRQLPEQAIC